MIKILIFLSHILFLVSSFSVKSSDYLDIPNQAKHQGYIINTFNSSFLSSNIIDLEDTRNSGFDWYVGRFFGWNSTPSEYLEFINNKHLRISPRKINNFSISTATRIKGQLEWVGRAFGGGGYFEAEIRFNPSDTQNKNGWPSFWAMSIEHLANLQEEQWDGQKSGYSHFIEVDIMEYLFKDAQDSRIYGANIHDWFGVWRETCAPENYCKHSIPYNSVRKKAHSEISKSEFHKYGFLWVPATNTSLGWGQFYFDDQPIGSKTIWKKFDDNMPSKRVQEWTFGILDKQHIVLILGSGKDQPVDIRAVRVWQKSNNSNWIQ